MGEGRGWSGWVQASACCCCWGRRFQAEVGMAVAGLSVAGWGRGGGKQGCWCQARVGMLVAGRLFL